MEWDEGNESELAAHAISPTEVLQLWDNGPRFARNIRRRAGDWKMIGLTNGGRQLTIVVRYLSDRRTLRPITGWPATDQEKAKFF